MKFLVIGAGGQVGKRILRLAAKSGDVIGTYRQNPPPGQVRLDLADAGAAAALVRKLEPDAVLIAGAFTSVDESEDRPEYVMAVNASGPGAVARAAASIGAHVVFLSTDVIFDGADGPYDEDAVPNPLGVYGRSKAEGERLVAASAPSYCIVRTSGVYSYEPGGNNFLMQVLHRFWRSEIIPAYYDQFWSPTYANALAGAVVEIAERRIQGILNVAGPQLLNRVEFCRAVARRFHFREDLIRPVTCAQVPQKAKRPLRAGLKVDRARDLLKTPLVGLPEALDRISEALPRE